MSLHMKVTYSSTSVGDRFVAAKVDETLFGFGATDSAPVMFPEHSDFNWLIMMPVSSHGIKCLGGAYIQAVGS